MPKILHRRQTTPYSNNRYRSYESVLGIPMFFLLVAFCLMTGTQESRAMGGASCGVIIPGMIGYCYLISSPKPIKEKIIDYAILTFGNAYIGAMIEIASNTLIKRAADAIPMTVYTTLATSTAITILWTLEKCKKIPPKKQNVKVDDDDNNNTIENWKLDKRSYGTPSRVSIV